MAMEYSDDESDEDFQFDASAAPRYVVPSYYQQLYSFHNLAPGAENDDDGWNSDEESCLPVLPQGDPHPILQEYKKPFMMYEDDVWVDEAKAVLSSPDGGKKISECLREMFDEHKDVFTLLLTFLQRSGKNRHQKQSLVRRVVDEFKRWLGQRSHPKNAVLTYDHQKEALTVLTRCHPMLMDDVCTIFDLKSTPEEDQILLIKTLLTNGKMNEAVTYTWKLGLQKHFNMTEMLLPLLAVDKTNMVENYIDGNREQQEEFVLLVDKLCEPGKTYKQIKRFLEDSGIVSSVINPEALMSPNSKLNSQQLYKLGIRFVQKYNLRLDMFPYLFKRKSSASLHHLLQSKYVGGSITDENLDELLEAAVGGPEGGPLKMQLIKELLRYNDRAAAAKWARRLNIAMEYLPSALQAYIISEPEIAVYNSSSDTDVSDDGPATIYYSLTIPLSQIVFVNDECGLQTCWETIAGPDLIIGVDCEWRLPACNGGIERLALMQLAISSTIFLLDMVHLPSAVPEKTLKDFICYLFGSRNNLKLGYGISADFKMISRSWTFATNVISSPKRVLDLQVLAKMVEGLKLSALQRNNLCSCSLPNHPILLQTNDSNSIPNHPLLHSTSSQHNHDHQKSLEACSCMHPSHRPQTTKAQDGLLSIAVSNMKLCDSTHISASSLMPPELSSIASSRGDTAIDSEGCSVGYSEATGLSLLVERCLGKPLDKSQQLSDWERRPLKERQIRYAALDAHCLLAVYESLKSQALSIDPHFNVEPTLDC